MRLAAGLCPELLGELTALPQALAVFGGGAGSCGKERGIFIIILFFISGFGI